MISVKEVDKVNETAELIKFIMAMDKKELAPNEELWYNDYMRYSDVEQTA